MCTFDCLLKQTAKQLSKHCMEHFIFYRSDFVYFHITASDVVIYLVVILFVVYVIVD